MKKERLSCPADGCGRSFDSEQGRKLHVTRMHSGESIAGKRKLTLREAIVSLESRRDVLDGQIKVLRDVEDSVK